MSDVPKCVYQEDDDTCTFCGDPMDANKAIECTECGSGVHDECIINNVCPWCQSWNNEECYDG